MGAASAIEARAQIPDLDNVISEADERRNADSSRVCQIRLHEDSPTDEIILPWHQGQGHRRKTTAVLRKGSVMTQPVNKVRAWFGWFTVPFDMQEERDETKRAELRHFFFVERTRAIMAWGDYPRPRKVADGTDPIGHARFPDVEVNVIEGDGTELGWIRLHELYRIGPSFDPQREEFARMNEPPEPTVSVDRLSALEERLEKMVVDNAALAGQNAAFLAVLKALVPPEKAAELLGSMSAGDGKERRAGR